MDRKEFLKLSAAMGLGTIFFPTFLTSCRNEMPLFENPGVTFDGKVIVIGAGSAGLMAGHVLNQLGIDFEILEASSVYGGRVKAAKNFVDFPIDLGAEWIHTDPVILQELINDENTTVDIETITYSPDTLSIWKKEELKGRNFYTNFYSEWKFKHTTWFEFFETYIVPAISDKISYEVPVESINYSADQIVIESGNRQWVADKVILTVPLNILRKELIQFQPAFPANKMSALEDAPMPDGIKVFIEFAEQFYPELTFMGGLGEILNAPNGDRIYYDAAFGKESDRNVLGLFTVGANATPYAEIETEEALIEYIIAELDTIFDGQASQHYLQHVVQNWSKEPFIRGSYSHYEDYAAKEILTEPIEKKIYFAGEAYAPSDDATVHGAGRSAYKAVERILNEL